MEADLIKLFMTDVDVVSSVMQQGGIEVYLELIDLFYTDGMKRAGLLKELIDKQDMERYAIEVHGLKGAAANIGANKLSALAKQHEMAGKASDITYIRENEEALFTCYNNCLEEIKRVLEQQKFGQFAEKEVKELAPIETAGMLAGIEEAYQKLSSFKAKDAAKSVEGLLDHAIPEEVRARLEQVQVLLKMYEHSEAEDILEALIQDLG